MSRLTLQQQLAQLESSDAPPRTVDPESAYTSLDSLTIPEREGDEGREHYLDVGPSTLRRDADQTLLGEKYEGKRVGRMKIFDDDEDDEEDGGLAFGGVNDEDSEGDEEEDEEDEDAEPFGDQEEDDDEEDSEEEDEEDEDAEEEEEEKAPVPRAGPSSAPRALDPVGSLRQARLKDIEKGRGISRQKALFDSLITLRITFQKALTASSTLTSPFPSDPSGQLDQHRSDVLNGLATLNEQLLELRTALVLPGTEVPSLGKRKRGDGEVTADYLDQAVKDSLAVADAQHTPMLGILNKWSNKINAASLAVNNSKAAGSSKFLQGTKAQAGVIEAIEAGIASRIESGKTFMESEETGYRLLLKEVIESRSGGGGADLSHLRKEKKKKREADRGGSKGRKLRYTIHEKAQNFLVPAPLRNGWSEEQMDELFSSLLGGAGMKGGNSEGVISAGGVLNGDEGLASLGGLRVF